MNRREMIKAGFVTIGSMVVPLKSVFALTDLRSQTVTRGLTQVTGKTYDAITDDDLLAIQGLELPHVHITTFLENDFRGLKNLKKLRFSSVFHSQPALPENVFRGLEGLETLALDSNQYLELPAHVFSPLESLKVLDLRSTDFEQLPDSIFQLRTLNSIYTSDLDSTQVAQLKDHYGDIVKEAP